MKIIKNIVWLVIICLVASCHKEPKPPIPEQELITTMKLMLTDTSSPYNSYTFFFRDLDGDGGADPVIDSIIIPAGKVFNASLLLLDERDFPADTSTNEIKALNTQHQFFYKSSPPDLITNFKYKDFDDDGKPLGNEFSLTTNISPETGILTITLRHQPDKNGVNVSNNDLTNAGGETDIEVNFPARLF